MKLMRMTVAYLTLLLAPKLVLAADAETDASANARPGGGSAAATARYDGDHGFARTDTRTGQVNVARGVAVGVDEHGLALSVSNAVAPRHGPAIGTTFNLNIGRDGDVSGSTGVSIAGGGLERGVTVGGNAGDRRPAVALASGVTRGGGRVVAVTNAHQHRSIRPVVLERRRRW